MDDTRIHLALLAMEAMAKNLMVTKGVAAILMLQKKDSEAMSSIAPTFRVIGSFERLPDPEHRGPDDQGSNYLAIAWSKICDMIRTDNASGHDPRKPNGETGYRGGVLGFNGIYTYVAFSGGTENEDVLIALAGVRSLGLTAFVFV
jgi:hypothetical protein